MTNIPPNAWKLFATLSAFQKDYAVIGGTATVFHLEERNAQSQRATTDLDMAILELTTASESQGIWDSLRDFFTTHNYNSQCLQSGKSQSFRFEAPGGSFDIPSIIEIFSEETVPNSERWVHRVPDAEMSAIVLPKPAIELVAKHKISRDIAGTPVSIASLPSLIVLKAIACKNLLAHSNPIERSKHKKHVADIIRLSYLLREGDDLQVPSALWSFVEILISEPQLYFNPQRIRDSLWSDYSNIDTRRTIKTFTPDTFANILSTYFSRSAE